VEAGRDPSLPSPSGHRQDAGVDHAPGQDGEPPAPSPPPAPSRGTVLREWGRIGCLGFGGPPAHLRMLRDLCVDRRRWIEPSEFEDALAACNLLPGPASTQMAIYCAWRVGGQGGGLLGGLAFVLPGLVVIVVLAALFLGSSPPRLVLAAGAGAGAAVAAVAVHAAAGLVPASWTRTAAARAARVRWMAYVAVGGVSAATLGPWLVLVLLGCGVVEAVVRLRGLALPTEPGSAGPAAQAVGWLGTSVLTGGVLAAVAWVAFKVGALSYGGGFVIIPLMQADAVGRYHWMTAPQFLDAVALGQVTPGPVVHTVSVVGYAAAGVAGALVAAVVAFLPSFAIVLGFAGRFGRLRHSPRPQAFLAGAGPAAIGAILGSAVPLTRALTAGWQFAVLALAAGLLFALRRGVVPTLLVCAAVGVGLVATGAPLPT
jgi:chromate transporter